jgi:hypothetical protein
MFLKTHTQNREKQHWIRFLSFAPMTNFKRRKQINTSRGNKYLTRFRLFYIFPPLIFFVASRYTFLSHFFICYFTLKQLCDMSFVLFFLSFALVRVFFKYYRWCLYFLLQLLAAVFCNWIRDTKKKKEKQFYVCVSSREMKKQNDGGKKWLNF